MINVDFTSHDTAPRLLDELDLAIVHTLQLDARAPWTRVASAVGADSATVARRWEQMREERLAWLSCWPKAAQWESSTDLAMVLLEAHADIAAISALPWTLSIDETSAGVVALVATGAGLRSLAPRVRELAVTAGLGEAGIAPRMHVVSAVHAEDSMWRTGALDPRGQRLITKSLAGEPAIAPKRELVAELLEVLLEDPRMSAATLASRLGVSEATARRSVDRATASGRLGLGCDLAVPSAGLRRGAMLWARSSHLQLSASRAKSLPQAYRVLEIVGPAPLCLSVRAATLTALPELERSLGEDIQITDRWTVLSPRKRNGHLLDEWGRTIGQVPVRW